MAKKDYQDVKMRYKYYKKGEHKKLIGHTVFFSGSYVDENGKIQEDFITLTQKDLFITALKKQDYFDKKK